MADYTLQLSDAEVQRYRMMAEAAVAAERGLWAGAGIIEGSVVADIGCGPGAVSVLLGGVVGSEGTVWAVDADPAALQFAAALAVRSGLRNVETVAGDAAATGLPPASLDVAMLRHVLAHNGGREQAIVDHLTGLVRPGRLCIWSTSMSPQSVRDLWTGICKISTTGTTSCTGAAAMTPRWACGSGNCSARPASTSSTSPAAT